MQNNPRSRLHLHRETVRSLTGQAAAAYPYTAMSACPECISFWGTCRQDPPREA